jgi:hypothetical protein
MLCYKNGALAREQVRNRYAEGDWTCFNELVEQTPPGNDGHMGLYFPLPEIIPPNIGEISSFMQQRLMVLLLLRGWWMIYRQLHTLVRFLNHNFCQSVPALQQFCRKMPQPFNVSLPQVAPRQIKPSDN